MLLEKQSYINNITSGIPEIYSDEKSAIHDEIDQKCEDWFNLERSILVITVIEADPEDSYIQIYEMDDLTGEIKLFRTCDINENKHEIAWEYQSKHYQVYWYDTYGEEGYLLERDINGDTLYDEDWCCNYLKINGNQAEIEKINL